jgi:hypothetical protein
MRRLTWASGISAPAGSGESLGGVRLRHAQWIDGKSGTTNVWAIEERPRATR